MAISSSTDRFNGVLSTLAIKAPCVAVAIANITLSGTQTVNGVAVVSGDRVLVTAQTSAVDNGIYDVDTSAWSRSADWDGNRDVVSGTFVTVATATVGRNPYYQVTTADPITIGTTAVNFTLADGPNVSVAITSNETAAGLTTSDINTSKFPSPVRDLSRYVDDNTGVVDESVGIQNAIDAAAQKGGDIIVPDGIFKCIGLILKTGVYFQGPLQAPSTQSALTAAIFKAASTGTILSTDGVATRFNCGVIGLGFNGLGAGTAVKGINFDDVKRGVIRNCSFDNISDEAILLDSDTGACHIEFNFAQNCLLDRTQAAKIGVLDINGNDHLIRGGEYTASLTSRSDANARLCAVKVQGGEHFLDSVIGEISDVGFHITGVTSDHKYMQCRADLNWTHGYEIEGDAHMHNCLALRNSRETTNTYDGFNLSSGSGNGTYVDCLVRSLSADAWKHRYGFNDAQDSDTVKNIFTSCRSLLHDTAEFNFAAFAGAANVIPNNAQKSFVDLDTTPDVSGLRNWRTVNTGATSITNFDGGISGQPITVHVTDANTTFVQGATLKTTTLANKLAIINSTYEFYLQNGIWYEVGEAIALAAYTRNATIVEDRTLLASGSATTLNNNNVLAALIKDLQDRDIIG